jgi:hypothetical protein
LPAGWRSALFQLLIACGKCRHRLFGFHLHNLVAGGLKLNEKLRQGERCGMLEIVHENDALAVLLQFHHDRGDYRFGFVDFEIEGINIGGEDADVAGAEIAEQFGRMPQLRETEQRSFGLTECDADRTDALLDFVFP